MVEINSQNVSGGTKKNVIITPLPVGQIFSVAMINLCETVNINVLFPFLAFMVEDLGHGGSELGYYAGGLAAAFCGAQFCSSVVWGWFSDKYGRKPAVILGTLGAAVGILTFGTAKTYTQAIAGRMCSGFLSGNLGVAKSFLTEITDDSNRGAGFSYFSLAWAVGSVVAPLAGGLLSNPADKYPSVFAQSGLFGYYPYLLPCLLCVALNLVGSVLCFVFMKETRWLKRPSVAANKTKSRGSDRDKDKKGVEMTKLKGKEQNDNISRDKDRTHGRMLSVDTSTDRYEKSGGATDDSAATADLTPLEDNDDEGAEGGGEGGGDEEVRLMAGTTVESGARNPTTAGGTAGGDRGDRGGGVLSRALQSLRKPNNKNNKSNNNSKISGGGGGGSGYSPLAAGDDGDNDGSDNNDRDEDEDEDEDGRFVNESGVSNGLSHAAGSSSGGGGLTTSESFTSTYSSSLTTPHQQHQHHGQSNNSRNNRGSGTIAAGAENRSSSQSDGTDRYDLQHSAAALQSPGSNSLAPHSTQAQTQGPTHTVSDRTLNEMERGGRSDSVDSSAAAAEEAEQEEPEEEMCFDSMGCFVCSGRVKKHSHHTHHHERLQGDEALLVSQTEGGDDNSATAVASTGKRSKISSNNSSSNSNSINVLGQKKVVLVTLNYGILAMAYILLEETIPLFLKLDALQGGFSFDSIQIGFLLSTSGGVMLFFTFFLLPRIANHSKYWLFNIGSLCGIPLAFAWPFIALLNYSYLSHMHRQRLAAGILWSLLIATSVLKSVIACISFTAVTIQINHSVTDDHLGAVNGMGQSMAALTRAVGPAVGGMLWSVSIEHHFVFFNFIATGVILIITILINQQLSTTLDVKKKQPAERGK